MKSENIMSEKKYLKEHTANDFNFLQNGVLNIYGGSFKKDFRSIFETLDILKEDRKLQDLLDWGSKGDGYKEDLQRELRELTYIKEDDAWVIGEWDCGFGSDDK
jgi:hypothetical protein